MRKIYNLYICTQYTSHQSGLDITAVKRSDILTWPCLMHTVHGSGCFLTLWPASWWGGGGVHGPMCSGPLWGGLQGSCLGVGGFLGMWGSGPCSACACVDGSRGVGGVTLVARVPGGPPSLPPQGGHMASSVACSQGSPASSGAAGSLHPPGIALILLSAGTALL